MSRGRAPRQSRRRFLIGASAGLVATLLPRAGRATPEDMQAALHTIIGEAPLQQGKVTLDLPPLVENGNVVPLTVTVESPMTEQDHVKAIHVLNQKNPQPYVITAHLGLRAGRAATAERAGAIKRNSPMPDCCSNNSTIDASGQPPPGT